MRNFRVRWKFGKVKLRFVNNFGIHVILEVQGAQNFVISSSNGHYSFLSTRCDPISNYNYADSQCNNLDIVTRYLKKKKKHQRINTVALHPHVKTVRNFVTLAGAIPETAFVIPAHNRIAHKNLAAAGPIEAPGQLCPKLAYSLGSFVVPCSGDYFRSSLPLTLFGPSAFILLVPPVVQSYSSSSNGRSAAWWWLDLFGQLVNYLKSLLALWW